MVGFPSSESPGTSRVYPHFQGRTLLLKYRESGIFCWQKNTSICCRQKISSSTCDVGFLLDIRSWWFRNPRTQPPLGGIKPINWCRISSINSTKYPFLLNSGINLPTSTGCLGFLPSTVCNGWFLKKKSTLTYCWCGANPKQPPGCIQLVVNWWFGLVVWESRSTPK